MTDLSYSHTAFTVALGNGHRGIGVWMWCLHRWNQAFCGIPEPLNIPAELTLLPVPQWLQTGALVGGWTIRVGQAFAYTAPLTITTVINSWKLGNGESKNNPDMTIKTPE